MKIALFPLLLCACTKSPTDSPDTDDTDVAVFDLGELPELVTETDRDDAPVYVFLYTHTEDHINSELSEERYTRIAPMIADIAANHQDSNISWTIQFIGPEALTVAERDGKTGIATDLRELANQGLINFGYHGQHDPTYTNRPQKSLTDDSTWEEIVTAFDLWVSCKRHPTLGGCEELTGGGIMAVSENFGEVQVVSGLSVSQDSMTLEGGGASHAVRQRAPERMVGFGISDHGSDGFWEVSAPKLMERLAPAVDTAPTLFWMDDTLRLSDGNPLTGAAGFVLHEELSTMAKAIDKLDRSRPSHINAHVASKYIYTAKGESPTKNAYANPTDPKLKPDQVKDKDVIDENYDNTETLLEWFATDFFDDNPGSHFVGPDDLLEMAAPDDYWEVSSDELDVLARWVVLNWGDGPPDWAFDGEDYYSLRDVLGLLAQALTDPAADSWPVLQYYGPLSSEEGTAATLDSADLKAAASALVATIDTDDEAWETTPSRIVDSHFTVGESTVNTAQLLYGLAYLYATEYAEFDFTEIEVPAAEGMPETYEILQEFNGHACEPTAWSLKPARIRESQR
ncbi:MAG: hypothetical protein HN348_02655 [Proteobacteria bacterium]|jgi:hypothetical protein|nr:hypothetical protein [Pseudomonadota bacterium]